MEIAMIDGAIVPLAGVAPHCLDRGTFFGDGVYEVVRSYDGRLFALDEHVKRLDRSLKEIDITGVDMEVVRQRVEEAFSQAGIPNCSVYFHITRGCAARSHTWDDGIEPTFFLCITELHDLSEMKETGVAASTFPDWRWKRCDIKTLNLMANILAKKDAERKGCFEAVLIADDGTITEGAGSAIFAVFDGGLVTRPLGPEILPSITRHVVLKLAGHLDIPVTEHAVPLDEAREADELFMAVTTKDILPIVTLDGKAIAGGTPGPVTKKLVAAFVEEVKR